MEAVGTKTKEKRFDKRKFFITLGFTAIFVGLMFVLFSGKNFDVIKNLFKKDITREEIKLTLSSLGIKAYVVLGILSMLQVVFTFVPAEPVQVMAGLSLGLWKGMLVCVIGVILGNTIIFILNKIYGQRLSKFIKTNVEFDFSAAAKSKKIAIIVFILYFLPAIPYGLICFFASSVEMKYPKYMFLTVLGSIPSVLIGVGFGHIAIVSGWIISVSVFVVLVALLIILYKNKAKMFDKINKLVKERQRGLDRHCMFLYDVGTLGCKAKYDRKIRIIWKNTVGRLKRPAIVLCPHGSFIDFIYSARILRKERPYFLTARLYFYHKILGRLMRKVGCIPKSMFSGDFESAVKCLKVISSGKVLVMMPEARLSTAGKFEDIQESTYKFIKKSNTTVYVLRADGDYFANPKWGDGARRGALVEVTLSELFTPEKMRELTPVEFKQKVDEALFYDEYEWLKNKPQVVYRHNTIAEGLENILYRCPNCGKLFSLKTKGCRIFCESCDFSDTLNGRYEFDKKIPFANIRDWYEWQNGITMREILLNPEYRLTSKVEVRHATKNKGFTEKAGFGTCTLSREGLIYSGTNYGVETEKFFPMSQIYRLLFGAGEDFEIYEGKDIWYFVPEEKRSAVLWYVVSGILKNLSEEQYEVTKDEKHVG